VLNLNPIAFRSQKLRGEKRGQRTLGKSALLYGEGLHSGRKSGLILEPLPPDSGIHFASISGPELVPGYVDFVQSTGYATTVRSGTTQAATIEHLLSAFHAYGICNVLVKCNGEIPVMDGSSLPFCTLIEDMGIVEQEGDWFEIAIPRTIRIGDEREFIEIAPADTFSIEYTLQYPQPLGEQFFSFTLDSPESYKKAIAPARTFGFVRDIGALQDRGLGLGGRFNNFVLFGDEGAINTELRFENEPVRHKILDCIGDLFLLGRPLRGRVTARMSGHSDNIDLLKAIQSEF